MTALVQSFCRFRRMSGLLAATALLGLLPLTAHAQMTSREGIELQNQIMDLKQQLSQVQSGGGSSSVLAPPVAQGASQTSGASGDLVAQLVDRVNTLEEQQREMRGQIEDLTNQLKEKSASLSKQMSDMQFAAQNGGGAVAGGAAAAAASSHAASSSSSHDEAAASTPANYLKAGHDALLKRDYAGAQENAESAIAHGKGATKVEGQYLLGQSLAGQKQYRQSAVAYYDAYRSSPKGSKAPFALLGVSASLISLGDKKAACQALDKLKTEFPSASEQVSHSASVFRKKASCS
ncbi:hypothetical protein [Acetobacter estunensis]|uniref:hypothetical protein n=1 Tax=Acetobacter estunensis TaxID=104097 RepID=UPI0020C3547F|nr:hypothetical protein [Acetobacter estunensis]